MTYFKSSEFDSPDKPGSGELMKFDLLQKLNRARGFAGIPFVITSGYRTPEHNAKVGGVPGSSHCKGLAVDIACNTSAARFQIVNSLMMAGFNRIGIGNTFIHVDCDPEKAPGVIWTYKPKPRTFTTQNYQTEEQEYGLINE